MYNKSGRALVEWARTRLCVKYAEKENNQQQQQKKIVQRTGGEWKEFHSAGNRAWKHVNV